MKIVMLIFAAFLAASGMAVAQECNTIPEKIPLLAKSPLAPSTAPGRQIDIYDVRVSGTDLTAKITMHGRGYDGCVIRDHPMKGTCEAGVAKLAAVVPPDDNRTCKSQYELRADQNWGGTHPGGVLTRRP